MRGALLVLALAGGAGADEIAKAQGIAKAGPAAARAAIPELIALGKGTPAERFAARDALAVAGPPAIAKLIEGVAGDASLRLLFLGVSHDLGAGVVAPALPALSNENPKIRAAAAASLGAAGPGGEAAVKQLVTALHDPDAGVRREAALALGGIGRGAHDAIPGLIHLASDPERGMTREALLALGMIVRDAAERERPAPKTKPEVAAAIDRGLKWLVSHQDPGGFWDVPASSAPIEPGDLTRARAFVAAVALLAMLDSGDPARYAPQVRAGLRFLVVNAGTGLLGRGDHFGPPPWVAHDAVTGTLCAAARVLGEPECREAAERAAAACILWTEPPPATGWDALAHLEAEFAGMPCGPYLTSGDIPEGPSNDTALLLLAVGRDDPKPDERLPELIRSCRGRDDDPDSWFLAARARWYAGAKCDDLVSSCLAGQRDDGGWDPAGDLGPAQNTACRLLCLEAASGLAHPLTMPLPDAPQLKAAVATLRIARQSKDEMIRAAAEQALAGFAVR